MSFWNSLGNFFGNVIPKFGNTNGQQSTWNHDNGYQVDSTAETAEQLSGSGIDPFGLVSGVFNDLTGVSSQQREFSQQEYLMDKQNEYNAPAAQMARMKAAGINANTAASGISQGGNESAQAPAVSSNTQGAANGLNALAGAAGAVTGGISDVAAAGLSGAQAVLAGEEANRIRTLLPLDTQLTLENIGLTRAQAQAVAIENYYRPESLMLDIAQKRLTLPILRQQFKVLQSEYDQNMANVGLIKQQVIESQGRVGLMEYQKLVMQAQAAEANANAQFMQGKFKLLRDLNWDVSTGITGLIAGSSIFEWSDIDKLDVDLERLQNGLFAINYSQAQGIAEGDAPVRYDYEKGLVKAREEAEHRLKQHQYHLDKGKDANRSLLDVAGSHVKHHGLSVGPVSVQ